MKVMRKDNYTDKFMKLLTISYLYIKNGRILMM